jgi:GAF domain-containing protein
MRFYAGAPLRAADGLIIGALCILDAEPRTLEDNDVALLETMAADVVATISTRDAEADTSIGTSRRDAGEHRAANLSFISVRRNAT